MSSERFMIWAPTGIVWCLWGMLEAISAPGWVLIPLLVWALLTTAGSAICDVLYDRGRK